MVEQRARRLGVGRAVVIRDAVRSELARLDEREHAAHAAFGHDLEQLHRRVRRLETAVTRTARRTAPTAQLPPTRGGR